MKIINISRAAYYLVDFTKGQSTGTDSNELHVRLQRQRAENVVQAAICRLSEGHVAGDVDASTFPQL